MGLRLGLRWIFIPRDAVFDWFDFRMEFGMDFKVDFRVDFQML